LDKSFGRGGIAHMNLPQNPLYYAVAVQLDGKVVAGGFMGTAGTFGDFLIVRFTKNGVPDSTFNQTGYVITDFNGGYNDYVKSIQVQDDGKIVAGGLVYGKKVNDGQFGIARYNVDGSLDTTFAPDGKIMNDLS